MTDHTKAEDKPRFRVVSSTNDIFVVDDSKDRVWCTCGTYEDADLICQALNRMDSSERSVPTIPTLKEVQDHIWDLAGLRSSEIEDAYNFIKKRLNGEKV